MHSLKIWNDCVSEGQQQFNRSTEIDYLQASRRYELFEAVRSFCDGKLLAATEIEDVVEIHYEATVSEDIR
jgi:hypothetical protein